MDKNPSPDEEACGKFPGIENAPIPLEFKVSLSGGRKPQIDLSTNLPEGTEVGAMVSSPGFPPSYTGQDEGRVRCGRISFGPFSKRLADLPAGKYEISVTAPLVIVQPASVRKYLGTDYGMFKSNMITKRKSNSELDGSVIRYETTLQVTPPS